MKGRDLVCFKLRPHVYSPLFYLPWSLHHIAVRHGAALQEADCLVYERVPTYSVDIADCRVAAVVHTSRRSAKHADPCVS